MINGYRVWIVNTHIWNTFNFNQSEGSRLFAFSFAVCTQKIIWNPLLLVTTKSPVPLAPR